MVLAMKLKKLYVSHGKQAASKGRPSCYVFIWGISKPAKGNILSETSPPFSSSQKLTASVSHASPVSSPSAIDT